MSNLHLQGNTEEPYADFDKTEDGYLVITQVSEFGESSLEYDPAEVAAIAKYLATEFGHL